MHGKEAAAQTDEEEAAAQTHEEEAIGTLT